MTMAKAMNRICKWKAIFASWQLGTRLIGDPECEAVRDHREVTIALRVESSALVRLLIAKGVITLTEYEVFIVQEAGLLDQDFARRFPGVFSNDLGMTITKDGMEIMKNWRP